MLNSFQHLLFHYLSLSTFEIPKQVRNDIIIDNCRLTIYCVTSHWLIPKPFLRRNGLPPASPQEWGARGVETLEPGTRLGQIPGIIIEMQTFADCYQFTILHPYLRGHVFLEKLNRCQI